MFCKFPKKRPLLPDNIKQVYTNHYKSNREGLTPASSLSQKMESWMHKKVALDISQTKSPKTTLELGAGTLNQLKYESNNYPYDIVEPFKELYENSKYLSSVRSVFPDVKEIPLQPSYDRITSIATLEHICDLPEVVSKCALLLNKDGNFRAAIPSEGTILWSLGWKLTTGLEFKKKYGLDYGVLMKHEHVNTAEEIKDVLSYFFSDIETSVFGISKSFSLYQFYLCSNPNRDKCIKYSQF